MGASATTVVHVVQLVYRAPLPYAHALVVVLQPVTLADGPEGPPLAHLPAFLQYPQVGTTTQASSELYTEQGSIDQAAHDGRYWGSGRVTLPEAHCGGELHQPVLSAK